MFDLAQDCIKLVKAVSKLANLPAKIVEKTKLFTEKVELLNLFILDETKRKRCSAHTEFLLCQLESILKQCEDFIGELPTESERNLKHDVETIFKSKHFKSRLK